MVRKDQQKRYHQLSMHWATRVPLVLILASCTTRNPASVCSDGTCSDPNYPFCDTNGAIGGQPETCIAVRCTPSQFKTCDGSNAITCNGQGDNYDVTPCDHGCNASAGCNTCTPGDISCGSDSVNRCGEDGNWAVDETCSLYCISAPAPHCAYISPRYLPDVCDTKATADLMVSQTGTLDSDLDATCTGGIITQTGAANICVMRYATISIASAATLNVVSSFNQTNYFGGRAVALVADGDVDIDGVLDVSAKGLMSGPGGGTAFSGGVPSASTDNGGGGAGFKSGGGAGGNASADGGAVDGGAASTDPALLTALVGGPTAHGGGGGGAAVIVSCRGKVSLSGRINAGGGGGGGSFFGGVGMGGGAGGYVVVQAPRIVIIGEMYANGGGGGAGGPSSSPSTSGQDGSLSDASAAGGGLAPSGAGNGGTGGIDGLAGVDPGPGKRSTSSGFYAGGGGGSVGFFQTYTPAGVTPTLTPAHVSPRFQPNGTVPTR